MIKKLLEASLEGEIENHLSSEDEENNRRNGRNSKTLNTSSGSFELFTPRDRNGSFEPQAVKKRQTNLHPELEKKILSMFASGMGYKDISSHIEDFYDHKISEAGTFNKVCQTAFLIQLNFQSAGKENIKLRNS